MKNRPRKLTADHIALTVDSTRGQIARGVLNAQVTLSKIAQRQLERVVRLLELQDILEAGMADIIRNGKIRVRVKRQKEWVWQERELTFEERAGILGMVSKSIESAFGMMERMNKDMMEIQQNERLLREIEALQKGGGEKVKVLEGMPDDVLKEFQRQLRERLKNVVDINVDVSEPLN